jgi:hypothetical protein
MFHISRPTAIPAAAGVPRNKDAAEIYTKNRITSKTQANQLKSKNTVRHMLQKIHPNPRSHDNRNAFKRLNQKQELPKKKLNKDVI